MVYFEYYVFGLLCQLLFVRNGSAAQSLILSCEICRLVNRYASAIEENEYRHVVGSYVVAVADSFWSVAMSMISIKTVKGFYKLPFYGVGQVGHAANLFNTPGIAEDAVYLLPSTVGFGMEHGDRKTQGVINFFVADIDHTYSVQMHICKMPVHGAALFGVQFAWHETPQSDSAYGEK